MQPFFRIFSLTLPSYGSLILLGLIVGCAFCAVRVRAQRLKALHLLLLAAYALLFGFLGAKLLYFLTSPSSLSQMLTRSHLLETLTTGFVFYGGLAGGAAGLFLGGKVHGISVSRYADLIIPALPLCHAFGRLGCFMAGCCYGIPVNPPLGITFSHSLGAPNGVPLFPVQLLEASLNLALFVALWQYTKIPRRPYSAVWLYLAAYSIMRFFLEYLRFDASRGLYRGLSTSQWLSIFLLAASALAVLLPVLHKQFRLKRPANNGR